MTKFLCSRLAPKGRGLALSVQDIPGVSMARNSNPMQYDFDRNDFVRQGNMQQQPQQQFQQQQQQQFQQHQQQHQQQQQQFQQQQQQQQYQYQGQQYDNNNQMYNQQQNTNYSTDGMNLNRKSLMVSKVLYL